MDCDLSGISEPLQKWLKECYDNYHKIHITATEAERILSMLKDLYDSKKEEV